MDYKFNILGIKGIVKKYFREDQPSFRVARVAIGSLTVDQNNNLGDSVLAVIGKKNKKVVRFTLNKEQVENMFREVLKKENGTFDKLNLVVGNGYNDGKVVVTNYVKVKA